MKLSQNLNDALNSQILIELENQDKYLQIASRFEDMQLKKLSAYFQGQASGEKDHANLFIQHVNDRNGGKVTIGEVDSPNLSLESNISIADAYVLVEQQTTESIEALYELALSEKSYIDLPFLSKMLDEQVEEEDVSQEFAAKLKAVGDVVLFDATFE